MFKSEVFYIVVCDGVSNVEKELSVRRFDKAYWNKKTKQNSDT